MLEPGTLRARVAAATRRAREAGALEPLPSRCEVVEEDGIPFLVRVLTSRDHKAQARLEQDRVSALYGVEPNPFLPYDPDLYVAEISATHVGLLNKYKVLDHHLLMVTRGYEEQEEALNQDDFAALWACMAEYEGLAFYNAGEVGGASQRHKHLQFVPLPLDAEWARLPVEAALESARFDGPLGVTPRLPFAHVLARIDPAWIRCPLAAATATLDRYLTMLDRLGLQFRGGRVPAPHNLLVTREWMLVVARSRPSHAGIGVNALGFVGALLVRDQEQLDMLRDRGPMALLRAVALPVAGAV